MYLSSAGFETWHPVTPPDVRPNEIDAVGGADTRHLIVLSGFGARVTAHATSDGGATWTSTRIDVSQIAPVNGPDSGASIAFASPTTAYAVLPTETDVTRSVGGLYETMDSGKTWAALPAPPAIGDLTVLPSSDLLLVGGVGEHSAYISTDDGRSWAEQSLTPPTSVADLNLTQGPLALTAASRGPAAVLAQYSDSEQVSRTVLYRPVQSPTGVTWQSTNLGQLDTSASPPVRSIDTTGTVSLLPPADGSVLTMYVVTRDGTISKLATTGLPLTPNSLELVGESGIAPVVSSIGCKSKGVGCSQIARVYTTSDAGKIWTALNVAATAG